MLSLVEFIAIVQLFLCCYNTSSTTGTMRVANKCTTVDKLNIYSFNATSIHGKLADFNSHFDAANFFDVISITESWLHDGFYDN